MKPPRTHAATEDRAREICRLRNMPHMHFTHAEIAALVGCERSNVSYYLARAKASLRAGVPFLRTYAPR